MARSEWTSASESSKDWAGTSTTSLTPTSQLESCSSNLRRYDRDFQCQCGSTKRIPKRVRVKVSRTSRTDEAAERCRLHGRRPLSLEAARDGAFGDVFFCTRERKFATNTCPKRRFWPPYAKVNTLRISKSRRLKFYFSLCNHAQPTGVHEMQIHHSQAKFSFHSHELLATEGAYQRITE